MFSKCSWLRLAFIHDHSIWISARGDHHRSVGRTSLDSPVMHDVLGEIFSKRKDG